MTRQTLTFAAFFSSLLLLAGSASGIGFTFGLSGTEEVPPVQSSSSGACNAILLGEDPEVVLVVDCQHNLDNVIAAHIHRGRPGENGPIVLPFTDPDELSEAFEMVDEDDLVALANQNLYVNIHTTTHPAGELRGQIRFQAAFQANFTGDARFSPLAGDQEVPSVTTPARGDCLSAVDDEDFFLVCNHDVQNPIAAHVHRGSRGQNGPIVVDLGSPTSPIEFDEELVDIDPGGTLAADFRAGNLYVNIHSTGEPAGEIRGQLDGCTVSQTTLCLKGNRFQVEIDWTSARATGSATAIIESADSGMFWFFDPSNLELLIKVLEGCGLNDRFWVFYAATTSVAFELRVTDTKTGQVKTYSNALGQFAEPVLDTSAFATCP